MKKTALLATAGSALALALLAGTPASADVEVFALITKTKDIHITETINITKFVFLQVEAVDLHYGAAAEADAILNQENLNNIVDHTQEQLSTDSEELINYGIELTAAISDSINDNTGVVNVNQDVGNNTNQGNQLSLAIATPATAQLDPELRNVFVNSQSEAEQLNTNNQVVEHEAPNTEPDLPPDVARVDLIDAPNKSASIDGSINDNTGIVNVNQNAGNNNNQGNSEAIAVAIDLAGVALSEAALGQLNSNTIGHDASEERQAAVFEAGVTKEASITNSINGNVGIGGVNQAAGNMANQANIFSLSFIDGGGAVGIGSGTN